MSRLDIPTEHEEQAALCEWMWLHRVRFFSVPNGARVLGPKRYAHLGRLRREGLTAGAPDLVLVDLAPVDGRPTMCEVKRTRGGSMSTWQRAMEAIALGCGWHFVVAKGCADGIGQLQGLGYGGEQ